MIMHHPERSGASDRVEALVSFIFLLIIVLGVMKLLDMFRKKV